MVDVLVFVGISAAFVGCGDRLARWMGLRPGPALERGSLAFVLSAGGVTLAGFLLAVTHLFSRASCLGLAGVLALGAWGPLREGFRAARDVRWGPGLWPPGAADRAMSALIAVFLGLGLVLALAPPTGMDAGVYHFTIPKLIVQDHGLVSREDVWVHKSGGLYLLYAFGMALRGEILAKLLGYGLSVAGVGLAAAAAERLRPGTARTAAFLVLSTPLSAGYLGYEYLELPILAYVLGALVAFLRAGEGRVWTVLVCALTGLSLSAKPSAFATALLAPVAVGALLWRDRGRGVPAAAASVAVLAATAGFWSLWNYATTGSLAFRYAGAFGEKWAGAEALSRWRGSVRLLGALATTGLYWTDSAGPFILAGLAGFLGLAWPAERRTAVLLCLAGVAGYIAVLAVLYPASLESDFGPRYLGPCLVGFGALGAAQFAQWARNRPGLLGRAVIGALLLPAIPLVVLKAGKAAAAAPVAVGAESRSVYLERKIETFAACEELNRLPSPGVKVLFVAVRPYYLDRPFVWIPYVGRVPFLRGIRTRDEFLRRVREEGITHVLYEPSASRDPWFAHPEELFGPPFREIGRWPWKEHDSVRLYALEAP